MGFNLEEKIGAWRSDFDAGAATAAAAPNYATAAATATNSPDYAAAAPNYTAGDDDEEEGGGEQGVGVGGLSRVEFARTHTAVVDIL